MARSWSAAAESYRKARLAWHQLHLLQIQLNLKNTKVVTLSGR
jgi:hypothetical protein